MSTHQFQAIDLQVGDQIRVTTYNSIGKRGEWWTVNHTEVAGRKVTITTNESVLIVDRFDVFTVWNPAA